MTQFFLKSKRWVQKWAWLLLLLVGVAGVVSTYTRLSETDDEPFHIKCGLEWWQMGTYSTQPMHPPLARVAAAILPYWLDVENQERIIAANESWEDNYLYRSITSRLGILPFYIISCLIVFRWSRELFGKNTALFSLGLYVTLSTVTGHGGLATTDMVYTAMLLWAIKATINWIKEPHSNQSILLGGSLGMMFGSKFSAIAHWPAAIALIVCAQAYANFKEKKALFPFTKTHLKSSLFYALPIMGYTIAIIYRFNLSDLWQGIRDVYTLNKGGFSIWLFGPMKNISAWYFFPVVFFFKTPLAFLVAGIWGSAKILPDIRHSSTVHTVFPLAAFIGILAISITSNINLGVRHVLVLYPLLCIPAGYGLYNLWQGRRWRKTLVAILLLWQMENFVAIYPEHIAYFNELAGSHPEHITLDSDFDWGQDIIMLKEAMDARDIPGVFLCARRDAKWSASILLHKRTIDCPYGHARGWIAISRAHRALFPDYFTWLNQYEAVQSVGRTMDLYFIPQ